VAKATDSDAERVATHVRRTLGDPALWPAPPDHTSVALAAIDAVWGIGVRWSSVRNVLQRYRDGRRQAGGDPESDGPEPLIALIEDMGGPEGFADSVGNRQRTSTRNGVLKAQALRGVAEVLRDAGLSTPAQVRAATDPQLAALRMAWTQVPGQGSGLSLDAFLMGCGRGGVKADRMVRRFVAQALGTTEQKVTPARAAALVTEAARRCGVPARRLDAAIWDSETGAPAVGSAGPGAGHDVAAG
jgi:hypothetical protein